MKRILFLVIITLMVACKKDSKTTNEVITTPKELSAGVYRAALTVQDNKELPFVFEVAENKTITIANAEERITVNDVVVENDSVFIRMEVFDAVIKAKIDDQDVKMAFLVFLSFIISIFILSSILALDYLTFENSFKLSILTLTNTVSSALYGMDNLSFLDLNSFTKMSLIFFMILGKIEIIAVIYLIKKFIFRE